MSSMVACNNCGDSLILDKRGDDKKGERAAWLTLGAAGESYDLCSVACLSIFVRHAGFTEALAEWTEAVMGVAQTINEEEGAR